MFLAPGEFRMNFSLSNYQTSLAQGLCRPPENFCHNSYYEVDPVLYAELDNKLKKKRGADLSKAFREIRKRTGGEYFQKIYPLQSQTLDYSRRSFPAYQFILPEVMAEDWLGIVDWGKFQRDHVLHQPLCGYIVLKLLDVDISEGRTLLDVCVDEIMRWEKTAYIRDFLLQCGMSEIDPIITPDGLGHQREIARNVWRAFFREAAYVAAVFHDLGYPWQYAERVRNNLDGMNTPAVRENRSVAQVVEQFGPRLLFQALQGYQVPDVACPSTWKEKVHQITEKALSGTHGFPGALGFLHLNDRVRRYPPSITQSPLHLLCVEWVATAIMMHDMCGIYWGKDNYEDRCIEGTPENPFLRLSFDKDPVSAIVTFSDVMQEFGRPSVDYGVCVSKGLVTLDYSNVACKSVSLKLDNVKRTLSINFRMADRCRAYKKSVLPKENRKYFDTQYGYLDLNSLNISKVEMLVS